MIEAHDDIDIVVVSCDIFTTVADGVAANLVLPCVVTAGDPVPGITWFREGVELPYDSITIIGGSLLLNVTMEDGVTIDESIASRSGVSYYCSATNAIGFTPFPAAVRSGDIHISNDDEEEGIEGHYVVKRQDLKHISFRMEAKGRVDNTEEIKISHTYHTYYCFQQCTSHMFNVWVSTKVSTVCACIRNIT